MPTLITAAPRQHGARIIKSYDQRETKVTVDCLVWTSIPAGRRAVTPNRFLASDPIRAELAMALAESRARRYSALFLLKMTAEAKWAGAGSPRRRRWPVFREGAT